MCKLVSSVSIRMMLIDGLYISYREKALSDLNTIKKRVAGLTEGSDVQVPEETIELFCKNASNIRVIQYKAMTENHVQPDKLSKMLFHIHPARTEHLLDY